MSRVVPLRLAGLAAALSLLIILTIFITSQTSERVLSAYTTSLEDRDEVQLANIRKASHILNGALVRSGDEFSLGKRLGPTTADRGWKHAPAIINDELEQAAAGGICQVASTLYNAVLLADLPVVERIAHSRPVKSVSPGRDATLAFGIADLRFVNNRQHPVKILTSTEGERLVVRLCGAGPPPPEVNIKTNASRHRDRLVVTCWKETGGQKTVISRDAYRLNSP